MKSNSYLQLWNFDSLALSSFVKGFRDATCLHFQVSWLRVQTKEPKIISLIGQLYLDIQNNTSRFGGVHHQMNGTFCRSIFEWCLVHSCCVIHCSPIMSNSLSIAPPFQHILCTSISYNRTSNSCFKIWTRNTAFWRTETDMIICK